MTPAITVALMAAGLITLLVGLVCLLVISVCEPTDPCPRWLKVLIFILMLIAIPAGVLTCVYAVNSSAFSIRI